MPMFLVSISNRENVQESPSCPGNQIPGGWRLQAGEGSTLGWSQKVCEQCSLPVLAFSAAAAPRVAGESVILTTPAPGRGPLLATRTLLVPVSVLSERPASWGSLGFLRSYDRASLDS